MTVTAGLRILRFFRKAAAKGSYWFRFFTSTKVSQKSYVFLFIKIVGSKLIAVDSDWLDIYGNRDLNALS